VGIDAADVNNELAVVEYVDDMYEFYKLTEVKIFPLSLYIYLCIFLSLSLSVTHTLT
jgi:hypothetical protein